MKIGFIGQGWIGKNYADDFENRGYEVVRYALEEPYVGNKELIKECNITFIAVPTPTTPEGFNDRYVRDALANIKEGNTAVIKSTITVGTTKGLQKAFPHITVFHSPEFLVEKTAAYDAANPNRNIVGIPEETEENKKRAAAVLAVLPEAPFSTTMDSNDAELVKYAGNCFLYTKVLFMNILYDLVENSGGDYESVREALVNDPRIGKTHTEPVNDGGRGAGGHCFIKDFEAFKEMVRNNGGKEEALTVLEAEALYNLKLLLESNKNLDLLEGVYGDLSKFR